MYKKGGNENKAKEILEHNNYYYITGYKELFRKNGKYKENIYFEDIYELYKFDRRLKVLFAETLFDIEQDVKTVFINNFSKRYGYKELDLVNPSNYDKHNKYLFYTLSKLSNQIKWYGANNDAVTYYRENYNYIPIWVLVKVLTFGMIRDLIFCQESGIQGYIAKKLVNDTNVKASNVKNMLELLIVYRNICCHDDILIGFIHKKVSIMTTPYHNKFKLKKSKNNQYIQGKKDMFAAIIAIKYFTSDREFSRFIDKLDDLINDYIDNSENISRKDLMSYMNLPMNFSELKDM